MNWTHILANALIPEPPGRAKAIADAIKVSAEKRRRKVDASAKK